MKSESTALRFLYEWLLVFTYKLLHKVLLMG